MSFGNPPVKRGACGVEEAAGILPDPELAAHRMGRFLAVAGGAS